MSKVGTIPASGVVRPDASNARVHFLNGTAVSTYHYTTFTSLGAFSNASARQSHEAHPVGHRRSRRRRRCDDRAVARRAGGSVAAEFHSNRRRHGRSDHSRRHRSRLQRPTAPSSETSRTFRAAFLAACMTVAASAASAQDGGRTPTPTTTSCASRSGGSVVAARRVASTIDGRRRRRAARLGWVRTWWVLRRHSSTHGRPLQAWRARVVTCLLDLSDDWLGHQRFLDGFRAFRRGAPHCSRFAENGEAFARSIRSHSSQPMHATPAPSGNRCSTLAYWSSLREFLASGS
jgi:hypothetical protein